MLEGIKEYRIKINIEKTKIIRINNSENMIIMYKPGDNWYKPLIT